MKKAIAASSVFVIVLALYQLQSLHSPRRVTNVAFRGFPMNEARPVDLDWEESTLAVGSLRERRDQIRDWLLMAVLSDAGLTESELNSILFDMPPGRFGYLQPVSAFEYGDTRSRGIGQGRVVALVPAGQTADARTDSLAHVADEQRKNIGRPPTDILVFDYEIAADGNSATVTRRAPVSGALVYTEDAGYRTAKVTDEASLRRFLRDVDDITDARVDGGLIVSGRKLHGGYRGVDVEDVAALWQSQAKIDEGQKIVDAFKEKWSGVRYRSQSEKVLLEQQYAREEAELEAQLAGQRHASGSGFSLDPAYDYDALLRDAAMILPTLKDAATEEEISTALKALQRHDEGPFLHLLYNVREKDPESTVLRLLNDAKQRNRYQAARYDGYLSGTRVGMTLFYTDLLAKLKAIDYWHEPTVDDFRSLTAVRVAAIYKKEQEEVSNTRLWFGPQDRGYQLSADQIIFARNATRIYAASSDPLQPGKEVAPNASSQAFLGWWDDHYEEVASYEPEYQRLNEIMKWSLVLSWLSEHGNSSALEYLDRFNVTRALWFPDWARTAQLRYRAWDRVAFYARGYKGSSTEAMPLLYSEAFAEFGKRFRISGGVSLGRKAAIHERAVLTPNVGVDELRLRASVDFRQPTIGTAQEIRMMGGLKHEFRNSGGRTFTVSSFETQGVKSRAPWAEIRTQPVERVYSTTAGRLNIDVKLASDVDLGRFYSEVLPNQPIRVGFRARAIDRGQAFAERVSAAAGKGEDVDAFIGRHANVEHVVKYGRELGCDGCFAVKLRGSNEYLKMQLEQVASADIPQGWQARAASLEDGSKNFNLAWVSENQLETELNAADYIRLEASAGSGGNSIPPTYTRGPPPGSTSDWNIGGNKISVVRDDAGNIYIPRKNLPAGWQDIPSANKLGGPSDPGSTPLARFLDAQDRRRILSAVADDPAASKRTLDGMRNSARSEADAAIVDGRAADALRRIERLMLLEGKRGDLLAGHAVAAVEEGNPAAAVRAIREAVRAPGHSDDTIALISRRLHHGTSDAVEADNLRQLAAMLDLGDGHPFVDGRHIAFEMRLAEGTKATRTVTSSAIQDRGPVYVLEGTSQDPYVATYAAMPDQVSRDLGTIVQLPRSDLAHARPLLIQTAEGKRYRLAGDAGTWRPEASAARAGAGPRMYTRFKPNQPACSSSEQTIDRQPSSDDCSQQIYLYDPPQRSGAPLH